MSGLQFESAYLVLLVVSVRQIQEPLPTSQERLQGLAVELLLLRAQESLIEGNPMGTRSTNIVGQATALYCIEKALQTGRLSRAALGAMLEIVDDDLNRDGLNNFTIVEGMGEDDAHWTRWREDL